VPVVERFGAAVAPWAATGTPFKRMSALLEKGFTPAELHSLVREIPGGGGLAAALAWSNPPATVVSDLTYALQRYGHAEEVLRAALSQRRHLEPEIRAVAAAWDVAL
jgi:hypothetical protein